MAHKFRFLPDDTYPLSTTEPASGTYFPHPTIGGRWIQLIGDVINLRKMGAQLDASDETDYLAAAVAAKKPIYHPGGILQVSETIDYDTYLNISGIGGTHDATGELSQIRSIGLSTPLFKREGILVTDAGIEGDVESIGTGSKLYLRDIYLRSAGNGSCLQVWNSVCPLPIVGVRFDGDLRGAEFIQPFTAVLIGCSFTSNWAETHDGLTEDYKAAVGMIAYQTRMFGCEAVGWGTGVRMYGAASFIGGRMEANWLGINGGERSLSQGSHGGNVAVSSGSIRDVTFEANDIGVDIYSMTNYRIENLGIQSSVAGPNGNGRYGFIVHNGDHTSYVGGITMTGAFTRGTDLIGPAFAGRVSGITRGNTLTTKPKGLYRTSLFNRTSSSTLGTKAIQNVDVYDKEAALAVDSDRYASFFGNLVLASLGQPDFTKAPVFGQNLCGTLVVANAATTASYTFLTARTEGNAQFNAAPSASAEVGSDLVPDTYYYATTLVSPRGENSITSDGTVGDAYKSVAIIADQKATMTFFGGQDARTKRRIYRGTELGSFDGFWEIASSVTTFNDDGTQAFDGYGQPPSGNFSTPSHVETDANYFIAIQPTWGTTWYVSTKLTTGFTITFGTAAPSEQTVGWLMYRP